MQDKASNGNTLFISTPARHVALAPFALTHARPLCRTCSFTCIDARPPHCTCVFALREHGLGTPTFIPPFPLELTRRAALYPTVSLPPCAPYATCSLYPAEPANCPSRPPQTLSAHRGHRQAQTNCPRRPYHTVNSFREWVYGTGHGRLHTVFKPSVYGHMLYTVQRAALVVYDTSGLSHISIPMDFYH